MGNGCGLQHALHKGFWRIPTSDAPVPLQVLQIDEYPDDLRDHHAWVQTLLLGATGLTALSTSTDTLPRSPIIQHLRLCHLEITVSRGKQMESCGLDISCCLTLESLTIHEFDERLASNSAALPMELHSMPRLKHVRLVDCFMLEVSLPAECLLFLDHKRSEFEWHEALERLCSHMTVLRLATWDRNWPSGIHGVSNLSYLELRVEELRHQDLADLRHIPHVRVVSHNNTRAAGLPCGQTELQLASGSWQCLEVYFFGELDLTIRDVDSFVRDTRSFTFSSEVRRLATHQVFDKILCACKRHGKACHLTAHKAKLKVKRSRSLPSVPARRLQTTSLSSVMMIMKIIWVLP